MMSLSDVVRFSLISGLFAVYQVAAQETPSDSADVKALGDVKTPMTSQTELIPQYYKIPAPRGLIVDRFGEPIAQSRSAFYVAFNLQAFKKSDNLPGAVAALEEITEVSGKVPWAEFDKSSLLQHWQHRAHVPFPLTAPLTVEEAEQARELVERDPRLSFVTRFVREYPMKEVMGHISGYARRMRPFQHGPLSDPEEMFPSTEGVEGLEKSFDELLTGTDGQVSYVYSDDGALVEAVLLDPVLPGNTVVTTLNGAMQRLTYDLLKKNGMPGAIVAMDALSGDILALASYPAFNPNDFTEGISTKDYAKLRDAPDAPLFPRATMGAYPPGSVFKPFVALAAMSHGIVIGRMTRYQSLPYVEIDGRRFHNWSTRDEGMIDVRYALLRSSNTWFYQAGVATGGASILDMARRFGFGRAPDISLVVTSGNLPTIKQATAPQAVANLSIGQGEVLVSPLQMAMAMAGLSVGTYVPEPRLVLQTQGRENQILSTTKKKKFSTLDSRRMDRMLIREGMWGVVNHEKGTAKVAAHDSPEVYGKTGTAQRMLNGRRTNVAWFTGYVGSNSPRIVFAAMVEGGVGESLSGGGNAAPLISDFVKTVYGDPEKYSVKITATGSSSYFLDELQPAQMIPGAGVLPVVPTGQLLVPQSPVIPR